MPRPDQGWDGLPVIERAPLSGIAGLHEFWASRTFQPGAQPLPEMQWRILLDTIGVGIEQTALYFSNQPDYATFEAWVLDSAGPPDPAKVERYHAWLAGDPMPSATRDLLARIEAMPPVLDADEMAAWDRDGVVVLRRAITRDEARAAEELLWDQLGASPDDPASWYSNRARGEKAGIMFRLFQHPALDAARRSPRVHKAFAQLWGTSDLWATTDKMSFNPPETSAHHFPGPHLHWDTSIALPIPLSMGGILYLTDTEADQGALQVVPGFHRRIEPWLASLGDANPRQVDLSAEAVTIPAGAGDLVIWRNELPHGASANRNTRPRLAQYITMYSPELVAHPEWR